AVARGLAMTANDGTYYVVGYGGKIELPTIDLITSEKTIVGNLVGTYAELVELMALADRGRVELHTREYRLSQANEALHDLHHGRIHGRALLIPRAMCREMQSSSPDRPARVARVTDDSPPRPQITAGE